MYNQLFPILFQLRAISHYVNEQIEATVSFVSKPQVVTTIRQRNIEVSLNDDLKKDNMRMAMLFVWAMGFKWAFVDLNLKPYILAF